MRRGPAALLARAFAAGRLDHAEYEDRLTATRDDGRLGVAEYAERAQRAAEAKTDEELAGLVANLRRPSSARTGRREARASAQDRQDTADGLKQALHDGQLDLDEFDERVRAAHGAHTLADLALRCERPPCRSPPLWMSWTASAT
ncbi:DUF1707 SHOCT-like domain-containing protein [Micromonospora sp. CPCC 206061]|uniref:DUF1707 SHOCT-like domain-containing protein n=1 Tax=Micromonospora sp. CPCC 206061 TaxID=3122410 RepID=UPI002FF2FB6C